MECLRSIRISKCGNRHGAMCRVTDAIFGRRAIAWGPTRVGGHQISPFGGQYLSGFAEDLGPGSDGPGASLSFSHMAPRSAHVAMNLCEAGEFLPIRFVGTASRTRTAPRQDAAQRAKAGYCPCCTQATRVAIPPLYAMGDFDSLKSRGVDLWEAYGSRAPRRLSAGGDARSYGQLSENWDWAAKYLYTSAHGPLVRATP